MKILIVLVATSLVAVATGVVHSTAFAQSDQTVDRDLGVSEEELVSICAEMQSAYDEFYAIAEAIEDDAKQAQYYDKNDPAAKYIPMLRDFEQTHHGTHAGLMAARRLVLMGAGGGKHDGPVDLGRRFALSVLGDYGDAAELPEIIRHLDGGNIEPQVETFLKQLINGADVSDQNRAFARYMLALWALKARDAKESWGRRLGDLNAGIPPRFPKEKEYLSRSLASALTSEKIADLEREAIASLESLCASADEMRQPGVTGIDGRWYIVRVDSEKSKSMPLLKDIAAGLLFKERHLRVGKPAPDLKLNLVSGEQWSLVDHLGSTIIIQFSFKGCGPCEAMYPDLRELAADFDEKLAVLSVMADEEQQTTVDAVKSGKMTWHVCWDGNKGPIATRWAVNGFPTVYVIGPDGRIAARGLRGEELKAEIAELTSNITD